MTRDSMTSLLLYASWRISINRNHDRLQQIATEEFAYLKTIGRVSGDPHRIQIWFGVDGDRIFLMSGGRDRSDWVKNVKVNTDVSIEIADSTFHGTARILEEETLDDQFARALLVQKYQKTNELANWGRNSLAIVIDLDISESS